MRWLTRICGIQPTAAISERSFGVPARIRRSCLQLDRGHVDIEQLRLDGCRHRRCFGGTDRGRAARHRDRDDPTPPAHGVDERVKKGSPHARERRPFGGPSPWALSSLFRVFTGSSRSVAASRPSRMAGWSSKPGSRAAIGDSVAVDGVCLTVVGNRRRARSRSTWCAETLDRTKPFGERGEPRAALRAGDPLGGHYVQGHVDGVGTCASGRGDAVWIDAGDDLLPLRGREGFDRGRRRLAHGRRASTGAASPSR